MKKLLILMTAAMLVMGLAMNASAFSFSAGDAIDQASADAVLDIVFASDTSGSMNDEMVAISNSVYSIVANLDCPDCDVWVRASFMGITDTYGGTYFDETVEDYVTGLGGTPVSDHSEDCGPAVTDLANWYNWNDDTTVDQDYYMAIVSIGDEGTEDGYPSEQADWNAAFVANQAAISEGIMVFSLVGTPYSSYTGNKDHRDAVFQAMAEGGIDGGYTFGNTGGLFYETTSETLESDIENIICTAGGGGTQPVPEPSTILLVGTGLLGIIAFGRKRLNKKV